MGRSRDERGFPPGWIEVDMVSLWYAMMNDDIRDRGRKCDIYV